MGAAGEDRIISRGDYKERGKLGGAGYRYASTTALPVAVGTGEEGDDPIYLAFMGGIRWSRCNAQEHATLSLCVYLSHLRILQLFAVGIDLLCL